MKQLGPFLEYTGDYMLFDTIVRSPARHSLVLALALITLMGVVTLEPAFTNPAYAQGGAPNWSFTGSLNTPRAGHTPTLLPNGKLLIAGGNGFPDVNHFTFLNSAELFDPATGRWSATGNLNSTRSSHTATLLANGKVLVVGGFGNCMVNVGCRFLNSAELYDPATGTWSITSSLNLGRGNHIASLLSNGKVLIAGGYIDNAGNVTNSSELYDPATGTFSITGNLNKVRSGSTATLLTNSKVLVLGGFNEAGTAQDSAELYDPVLGIWSSTANLHTGHFAHTATLLPNGKVLVAGGGCQGFPDCDLSDELYDPATGMWSVIDDPNGPHYGSAALLLNGRVLVGGNPSSIFDPVAETWSFTASPNIARNVLATLLPGGKVLFAGGSSCNSNGCVPLDSAELYDPGSNTTPTPTPTATATPNPTATPTPASTPNLVAAASWTLTGNLNTARDGHTATLLQNGKVLVAGGAGNNGSLNSAELYDPATGIWSITGNLNSARSFHTATLLSNGKVLVAGGDHCLPGDCFTDNTAEIYDPTTGTWSSTGTLITARAGHTATLLPTGKTLVVGGFGAVGDFVVNSAEQYDPVTGAWSSTGNPITTRGSHTATLLPGGKVLVAGGNTDLVHVTNNSELYDPATGTWSNTGNLNTARELHSATLLPNGKVLVAGGFIDFGNGLVSAELYDPATGLWSITGNLNTGRAFHTATLLPGGKVLVAGGFFVDGLPNITNRAELYDPATGTWSNTTSLNNGRRFHTATLLLSGKVLASGGGPGANTAELYDAGSEPVVLTADQVALKSWTYQGRTYAYVKLSFPNDGYRVANWGQAVRAGNDFTADAAMERSTGASVQAVTTTAQIYDLGPLADGTYNFNFKSSGTLAKTLQFTVSSVTPPPNPIDNAREFVRWQYRDFLNREADQAGEDFWTDNITKCSDPARRPAGQTEAQCTLRQRETTSGAFFLSPEFQYTGYYVYRMYVGGLGRQPKLSEFTPDALFVGAGIIVNGQLSGAKINQNKADFAQQFVNCTDATKYRCGEFKAIYDGLSNQQYVDKLFQTTGVNASAADRTALVNGLNANPATETRASVLQKVVDGILVIAEGNQQFTTSYGQAFYDQQFNRAFVQLEYFGYMKRDPDEAGYAFWLGKLNQYPSFVEAEMVLAFISSPEYRARFGQP